MFAATALVLSILLAFSLLVSASAEEAAEKPASDRVTADATPVPSDTLLLKMKVRELKALLAKKGPEAACVACTSKGEYVDRVRETAEWADVIIEAAQKDDSPSVEELAKMFSGQQDSAEMEKIKADLKAAGVDTSNMFSAGQLNKDSLEAEMKKWDAVNKAKGKGDDVKSDL